MSDEAATTARTIEINDLPPEGTLTAEEKELLAGASRYKLSLDAIDTRQMMRGGISALLVQSVQVQPMTVPAAHAQPPVVKISVDVLKRMALSQDCIVEFRGLAGAF